MAYATSFYLGFDSWPNRRVGCPAGMSLGEKGFAGSNELERGCCRGDIPDTKVVGREYWLPVSVLLRHFLIKEEENTGDYVRPTGYMSHFSITILLSYIKDKVRYAKLKAFVEAHIIAKLKDMKAYCPNDAETLIMLLDLVVCPYISTATKDDIGQIFGLDAAGLSSVQSSNDHWFTAWGDKFDLGKELDEKRSRGILVSALRFTLNGCWQSTHKRSLFSYINWGLGN